MPRGESYNSAFGTALRTHREQAGFSLRELAARVKFSPGHLSHVENGRKPPTLELARACEREFGLAGHLTKLVDGRERRVSTGGAPAQLPGSGGTFFGRQSYLDDLRTGLTSGGQIVVVEGPPGIGKTALVVKLASTPELARRFPDGILFADLCGFTPGEKPAEPHSVLEDFLRSSGAAIDQIPDSEPARSALFRTLLRHRRMLVVLDNAASVSQVRPLLPGASECGVIVTSRRRLAGLSIRDGATRVSLGPLRYDEASGLLTEIIGERAAEHPDTIAELAELCSYWPLALRVVAERAVATPRLDLGALCRELRETRLDALSVDEDDDGTTAVRAVFSLSYEELDPSDAATFRLLGLHPGTHIGLGAVAALAGRPAEEMRARMDRLCRAHLVEEHDRDRYRLHDLLRLYAAERAPSEDDATARRAALTRLLDYYFASVDEATGRLAPFRMHPVIDHADFSTPGETFESYEEALAWCDRETPNFPAVMRTAAELAYSGSWRFAAALWDYFHLRQPWSAWWSTSTIALDAARDEGDRYGEAWVLTSIGDMQRRRRDFTPAYERFSEAIAIRREIGDLPGQGWLWFCFGSIAYDQGNYSEAVSALREGLRLFTELEDVYAQGRCRQLSGQALLASGDRAAAIEELNAALELFAAAEDEHDQALVWSVRGTIESTGGSPQTAVDYFEAALTTLREVGDWQSETQTLVTSGEALWRLGRTDEAHRRWNEALDLLTTHCGEAAEIRRVQTRIEAFTLGKEASLSSLGQVPDPFDITEASFIEDPYSVFDVLRRQSGIHRHEQLGMRVGVSYAVCSRALRDRRFAREWADAQPAEEFAEFNRLHRYNMLSNDAGNRRLRSALSFVFARQHTDRLRALVTQHSSRLVDEFVARIHTEGSADVIEHLAAPLSVGVITDWLGFPAEDREQLRSWSNAIVKMYEFSPDRSKAESASARFNAYIEGLIAQRREQPGTDLLSELVRAVDAEGELSNDELVANYILLLMAGHEASVNALGNSIVALYDHPRQWRLLRDELRGDPVRMETAADELLRYDTPNQLFERTAVEEAEIAGVRFEPGDKIGVLLGAANRDPAVFTEPDQLDLTRTPNPHVALGAGLHYCLGAPPARMELATALADFAERLPHFELAATPRRKPEYMIRGYDGVFVRHPVQ